ncbi:hypothetical protein GCM10010297_53570 [Streptomyces malachitofuscus]|nr:hypothetical protein GCM10010297_53570 [Streptomyces malachitofuscus]
MLPGRADVSVVEEARAAARTIARAATARRPRTRYTVGATAAFLVRASCLLPDRVLDRMKASDLRKHHPDRTGRTERARRA